MQNEIQVTVKTDELGNIVMDKLKALAVDMRNVVLATGDQVVHTHHMVSTAQ